MFALSRDAGRYVISEPELQAQLAEREAAGRLRCALCGEALAARDAAFWRRRLDHRWATLPVHRACAAESRAEEGPAAAPAPLAAPGPEAGGPSPAAVPEEATARLGRLAGRAPLPLVVLEYPSEAAVLSALLDLRLGDAVPVQDFDPVHGAAVRAVHASFPEAQVFAVAGLRIRPHGGGTAPEQGAAAGIELTNSGGAVRGRLAPPGGPTDGVALALLHAAASFSGPDQVVAALLATPASGGRPTPATE